MKILYYSPHPHLRLEAPTGYGTHMREMIIAWRKKGVEVRTLIAGDRFDGTEQSALSGGESKKDRIKKFVPSLLWESAKDAQLMRYDAVLERELAQLAESFKPDVIYERVAYLQNSGIKTARRLGIKHIAEINAPYPQERHMFSGKSLLEHMGRNTEREILVHSSAISVVSSALKRHFEKLVPDIGHKIAVVPNAVNPEKVAVNQDEIAEFKRRYTLDGELVVGFVGSIFPYHGVDILIEAFAKVQKDLNIKLMIVGDGAVLSNLKSLALSLGIMKKVIFTGSVPHREVYALIEIMDICVMAKSNWYGSPVKIFEYGLMKKAVIAPDEVPVRDVMGSEEGLLVKPDIDAFGEALNTLIHNQKLRESLALAWNKKVMSNYTWDRAAQNTLDLCM